MHFFLKKKKKKKKRKISILKKLKAYEFLIFLLKYHAHVKTNSVFRKLQSKFKNYLQMSLTSTFIFSAVQYQ